MNLKLSTLTLTFILLFISPSAMAEFGKVVDTDGYVNVRAKETSHSLIKGQIKSGQYVYVNDEERYKNWLSIYSEHNPDSELNGYVHHSRIKFIDDTSSSTYIPQQFFDKVNGLTTFFNNDVNVTIKTEENFDYQSHADEFTRVTFPDSIPGGGYYFSHFRGSVFWGTDGMNPDGLNHYQSITAKIKGKSISIPKKDIESLFNINFSRTNVYYDSTADTLYISAIEGSGAGTYAVLFVIAKGKYIGRTTVLPY